VVLREVFMQTTKDGSIRTFPLTRNKIKQRYVGIEGWKWKKNNEPSHEYGTDDMDSQVEL